MYSARILTVTLRRARLLLLAFWAFFCVSAQPMYAADKLPARLSDGEFRDLIAALSEPGGLFSSENVLSNEAGFSYVIPELQRKVGNNGVYLGVGPEQNFNYIAAVRPKIAFIIDIRRENLLEHLLYKALFEMSEDRIDFVSRLFSRTRPDGLSSKQTGSELFRAFANAPVDQPAFQANLAEVEAILTDRHQLALSHEDILAIEHLYSVFRDFGPQVDYVSTGRMPGGRMDAMPTYADLMTEKDTSGRERSYLATEQSYAFVRNLERLNLIVPVVGDFGGPTAIRAVGRYLKEHRAVVTVFYLSNVEAYLFRNPLPNLNGGAVNFYNNVRSLPLTASSTFVRSIPVPSPWGGATAWQSLVMASIQDTIKAFDKGRLERYTDVFRASVDGARRAIMPELHASLGPPPPNPVVISRPRRNSSEFSRIANKSALGPRLSASFALCITIALAALLGFSTHHAIRRAFAAGSQIPILVVLLVAVVGLESSLLVPYWDEFLNGRTINAEVVQLDHDKTDWIVGAFTENAGHSRLRAEIDPGNWSKLQVGDRVPFRVVPARPSHYEIGTAPRLSFNSALVGSLGVIPLAAFLLWMRART